MAVFVTILAFTTQRTLYSLECVKVNSQQVISTILHSPHLWERRMAHFSAPSSPFHPNPPHYSEIQAYIAYLLGR